MYPLTTKTYSEHSSWLLQWLSRRMPCSTQASDLMQDTFEKLLKAEANHKLPPSFNEPRHYLVTVAKRVLIDHLRRKDLEKAYLSALEQMPEPVQMSEEEKLVIFDLLLMLDNMLDGLGTKVKQTFIMVQLNGMSYAEIAAKLNISISSVTKYMAKATAQCLIFSLDEQL